MLMLIGCQVYVAPAAADANRVQVYVSPADTNRVQVYVAPADANRVQVYVALAGCKWWWCLFSYVDQRLDGFLWFPCSFLCFSQNQEFFEVSAKSQFLGHCGLLPKFDT